MDPSLASPPACAPQKESGPTQYQLIPDSWLWLHMCDSLWCDADDDDADDDDQTADLTD